MDITLEELKQMKEVMENQIQKSISDFRKATGLTTINIDIINISGFGDNKETTVRVSCNLKF